MRIIIKKDPVRLAEAGVEIFSAESRNTLIKRSFFSFAVSGGSTPRLMHQLLAKEPYLSSIPWARLHVFWVDERCVPEEDQASNSGTAKRDLFDKVPIPGNHIHPMPGNIPPQEAENGYQKELKAFFQRGDYNWPVFDLVFLGVGADGHTASLFPGQQSLKATDKWVLAVKGGDPDVYRLTLTLPVINATRKAVFLVSGKKKAEIVKRIFHGRQSELPAQMVRPVSGELIWLLDEGAASLLRDL